MTSRIVIACLLLASAAGPSAGAEAQITTISGEGFAGRLIGISQAAAEFATASGVRKVAVRDLWQIRLADHENLLDAPGQKVVVLAGRTGGMLAAKSLAIKADKLLVESKLMGQVALDVTSVAAIYLPARDQTARSCRNTLEAMGLPQASQDCLIAKNPEGTWVPVPGVLKAIGPRKVTFEFSGEDRTIDLSSVQAVRLAPVPKPDAGAVGQLIGRDGSAVPFSSISLAGAQVSIAAARMKAGTVSLSAVAEIRFGSDRCVYLSDIAPAKVVQVGLFDVAFACRTDLSAAGKPIQLDGRTYARGLGLHSRCELTYDLAGKFATFAALAGIDAAGENRGNATLKILGDGKELIQPTKLTGSGKAAAIRCSVAGVKQFTILVDFGDDGIDVGDHVSLADARLIKP